METLPKGICFLAAGYSEDLDFNMNSSGMDSGIKKMRPGRSKPLRVRKGSLLIGSADNKKTFEAFIGRVKTNQFNYIDPVQGGTKKCRFVNEVWSFTRESGKWRAQCEMESIG